MATPIISIVGKSKSGKTTFLEKVVPILAGRGYRVATVKHHSHPGFEMDQPGKDSWRHFQAGACITVIAAPDKMAIVQRLEDERSLRAIARQIALTAPVDLIITEGYSRGPAMKIEVVRAECSAETISALDELLALVSDVPPDQLPPGPPVFPLDAAEDVADLVECYLVQQRIARVPPDEA